MLFEYKGKVRSRKEAQRQYERSAAEAGHNFFLDLDDGRVIDGGIAGNSARWVNHSCAPNCETEQQGSRVFFRALRDIEPGEELFFDYRLFVDGRRTTALKQHYRCCCWSPRCRGTMLVPAGRLVGSVDVNDRLPSARMFFLSMNYAIVVPLTLYETVDDRLGANICATV